MECPLCKNLGMTSDHLKTACPLKGVKLNLFPDAKTHDKWRDS